MEEDGLMDELYRPKRRPSSNFSKLWLIGLVALLVFSFFAFVFATASYAETKKIDGSVQNNIYQQQQGGMIEQKYSVVKGTESFSSGQVLSFCDSSSDDDEWGVCPGYGPMWNETLLSPSSLSPAFLGSLIQLSPSLAVYVWVTNASPTILRFVSIFTNSSTLAYATSKPTSQDMTYPITFLAARSYSPTSFVVSYTSSNYTYLLGGFASSLISLVPPVAMFATPDLGYPYPIDLVVLGTTVLVTYGPTQMGAGFQAFYLSTSSLNFLNVTKQGYGLQIINSVSSVSLGDVNGLSYFLQATGDKVALGSYSVVGGFITLTAVRTLAYKNIWFDTVTATSLFNGYISLVGVHSELMENPLTISMIVQWSSSSPSLTIFSSTNLLETENTQMVNNQISICYSPASSGEPRGELFFSYVDFYDRAKIVRAKIVSTQNDVQLLPSPPVDISTFPYSYYGDSISPLLACNSTFGVVVAYQYLGTYFNSFQWQGGYQIAGIAQDDFQGSSGSVSVVRQGISSGHKGLQPGFSYYMTSDGHLSPQTSIIELFSPASFQLRIGVAISDTQLLLDPNVFDNFIFQI